MLHCKKKSNNDHCTCSSLEWMYTLSRYWVNTELNYRGECRLLSVANYFIFMECLLLQNPATKGLPPVRSHSQAMQAEYCIVQENAPGSELRHFPISYCTCSN